MSSLRARPELLGEWSESLGETEGQAAPWSRLVTESIDSENELQTAEGGEGPRQNHPAPPCTLSLLGALHSHTPT